MKLSFQHTLMLLVAIVSLSYGASPAEAQTPGTLDSTFGSSGKVTTSFGGVYAAANAVAVQLDGKLVVVGETRSTADASSGDFAVARYNTDGTLDVRSAPRQVITGFEAVTTVQLLSQFSPTAKLSSRVPQASQVRSPAICRMDNWTRHLAPAARQSPRWARRYLCTSMVAAPATLSHQRRFVALQPDGRIVVGGTAFSGWWLLFEGAIARYNANGTLDASLNGSQGLCPGTGVRLEAPSGFEMSEGGPAKAALMSDGRILLGVEHPELEMSCYGGSCPTGSQTPHLRVAAP